MKYSIGTIVIMQVERTYTNGDKVTPGTQGEVRKVYEFAEAYSVQFSGCKAEHRVLEEHLKRA